MGFMVRDSFECVDCDCDLDIGSTVWYCDLCGFDACSWCMGYGEDPYGHAARAQCGQLSQVRTAADLAHSAACHVARVAALAPPSLVDSVPFRESSLHVSNEWLARSHPAMEVDVCRARLTRSGGHVERTIRCKQSYPSDGPTVRRDSRLPCSSDDQSVLYTPAREHEFPAHQRRRTKRFRMREEQVLSKLAQHFSLSLFRTEDCLSQRCQTS